MEFPFSLLEDVLGPEDAEMFEGFWGDALPDGAAAAAEPLRCLDRSHGASCSLCSPAPAAGVEGLFELVGEAGKKNGERMLRTAITQTPEWACLEARTAAAELLERAGGKAALRLAATLRSRQSSALHKPELLALSRLWGYRSTLWARKGRRRAQPAPAPAPPPPPPLDAARSAEAARLLAASRASDSPFAEAELLCGAVASGDAPLLSSLLQCGAQPWLPTSSGRTALHEAASLGHATSAAALLAASGGRGLSAVCAAGETPLLSAALAGHESLAAQIAAQGGALPGACGREVHLAVSNGDASTLRLLHRCGADLGSRVGGLRPLKLACTARNPAMVVLLLQLGAPGVEDVLGTSPHCDALLSVLATHYGTPVSE